VTAVSAALLGNGSSAATEESAMPVEKDRKRLVRARMKKTGESYTAARAQLQKQSLPSDRQMAELAGMSDDAVRAKTGHGWRHWVRELDSIDASSKPHLEIARHVHDTLGVPDWWSQTVTVGYERIRGLREVGQRRGTGTYEANKSKTVAVPVSRLYRAFTHAATRAKWLPGVKIVIRTRIENRSLRITWPDQTSVLVGFIDKGAKKSRVAIQHVGLSDREQMTKSKEFWAERFDALGALLQPK
jgi:uncharacterized protein YndB with AHSA1/START domain